MATGTESALLQPASIREIGAFLATLPSRPRLTWWALLICGSANGHGGDVVCYRCACRHHQWD
ncbi:hypothetical protein CIP107517_00832 [Corynebacterium diphtheriae]|nr:hypothetical protein CIP107517_00832 [Corynebacterium diphtheriae]